MGTMKDYNAAFAQFNPARVAEIKCQFCGRNSPDAYWAGDIEVFICEICAPKICGALLADAVSNSKLGQLFCVNRKNPYDAFSYILKRFKEEFWRAATIQACAGLVEHMGKHVEAEAKLAELMPAIEEDPEMAQ